MLIKDAINDSAFHIASPLRGNQGVSIQPFTFPAYRLTMVDKGTLDFTKDIKEVPKATFYIEERK